jgi:hypothetical protein
LRRRALGLATGALLAATGAASAHHALEALYDTSEEVTAMATLLRIDWINPHAWMRFDIRYPDGHVAKNSMVETLSTSALRTTGVNRNDLKIGDTYEITFYPTRDRTAGGFMTKMLRRDGTTISKPEYVPEEDDSPDAPDLPSGGP